MHYLRPLRLYLTATVLFFFVLSLQDPIAESRTSITLQSVPSDTLLSPRDLEHRLADRKAVAAAEAEAVWSAVAASAGTALSDSLRPLALALDSLREALDDQEDAYDALADSTSDSLVSVAGLPPRILRALADTGHVEILEQGQDFIAGSLFEDLPVWMRGDLARRLNETESPVERRLLAAQYQRAVLSQVPTALILILPIFALLLKLFYATGAGRKARFMPRPASRATSRAHDAWTWVRARRWQLRRARHRWRRARARRRVRRPLRGALTRARRRASSLPILRPWRVRRIRMLRDALRGARRRFYSEHLVFALHVHAFTFAMLIPFVLLGGFGDASSMTAMRLRALCLGAIPLYFLIAQHRVYGQSWPKTVLKSTAIGVAYFVLLGGGAAFAATLALRLG